MIRAELRRHGITEMGMERRNPARGGRRCPYLSVAVLVALLVLWGLGAPAFADELSARAAVVMESETGNILYAKNPNLRLPPASTTKLVTAMVVLDSMNPDHIVTISANAAQTPSVAPRIKAGERYSVRDLLRMALMRSLNSATVALAEAVAGSEEEFVRLMNARVAQLGATNSRFGNASGLPGPDQHVTAYELAKIMRESLHYPLIVEIIGTKTAEIKSREGRKLPLKNTNHLLWNDERLVVGKTGYTRAARHCLVTAADDGQRTLITALLGESERDDIWKETVKLIRKGEDVLDNKAYPTIYVSQASFARAAASPQAEARPVRAGYVSRPDSTKNAVRNIADSYVSGDGQTKKGSKKTKAAKVKTRKATDKKKESVKPATTKKKGKKTSSVYSVENRTSVSRS